jgi:hypothetical protein
MLLSAGEASEAGVVKASALVPGSSALGRRVIIVDAVHICGAAPPGVPQLGARGRSARRAAGERAGCKSGAQRDVRSLEGRG